MSSSTPAISSSSLSSSPSPGRGALGASKGLSDIAAVFWSNDFEDAEGSERSLTASDGGVTTAHIKVSCELLSLLPGAG